MVRDLKRKTAEFSRRLFRCQSGNAATMAAMTLPVCVAAMALAVDEGALYFERRELQATTDIAAIVAAANIGKAELAARQAFADNAVILASLDGGGGGIESGEIGTDVRIAVTKGRYLPDKSTSREARFQPGTSPQNAVRVTAMRRGKLYFGSSFRDPPVMSTTATARASAQAAFAVGSRLASLNGGVINQVLGGLTGSSLSLSVMDYEALLDAQIDGFKMLDGLASSLGLQAATYDEVLKAHASLGQIATVLASVTGKTAAISALDDFERSTRSSSLEVPLSALFNLGSLGSREIGHGSGNMDMPVSVFDVLSGAIAVADGKHQVKLDLGASIPGIAATSIDLAIGEPPQGSSWFTVGEEGSVVRTAQTRLRVLAQIGGSGVLSGVTIKLPIYVELASAKAQLTRVNCPSGQLSSATVDVAVTPAAVEAWIGDITVADMADFDHAFNVKKTAMVDALGIKATGYSHLAVTNVTAETLTFSSSDIGSGNPKSVSTEDLTQSVTRTLLGDLDLRINILGLGLGSVATVRTALTTTLSQITPAIDGVVSNTLNALGLKIGEADVWVNGVLCQRSVLVQ